MLFVFVNMEAIRGTAMSSCKAIYRWTQSWSFWTKLTLLQFILKIILHLYVNILKSTYLQFFLPNLLSQYTVKCMLFSHGTVTIAKMVNISLVSHNSPLISNWAYSPPSQSAKSKRSKYFCYRKSTILYKNIDKKAYQENKWEVSSVIICWGLSWTPQTWPVYYFNLDYCL